MIGALVTSLRKTPAGRSASESSGDFSALAHQKPFGRDIDPPYVIGHCTGCRRFFVYPVRPTVRPAVVRCPRATHLASIIETGINIHSRGFRLILQQKIIDANKQSRFRRR